MTIHIKRRKRNRLLPQSNSLLTPWNNDPLLPLSNRIFSSKFNNSPNFLRINNAFKGDFIEDDSLMPAMNIKEHKDDFEIEFAAPSFNKKDFVVSIEDNILHVCGKKNEKEEQEDEDYSCKEFSYKSFKRSSSLPTSIDLNQDVKASYKNGILKVKLFKKDEDLEEPLKKVIVVD